MDEAEEAREQHQALLVLSRRILFYVAVSTVLNVSYYFPVGKLSDMIALVRAFCVCKGGGYFLPQSASRTHFRRSIHRPAAPSTLRSRS